MSIVLYKKGNSYTSPKGIRCEFQICNPHSYLHLLDDGWFLTPEECYPEPEVVEEELKSVKEDIRDKSRPFIAKYSDPAPLEEDAIRAAAKAAGISNWYNKGIDKLTEELETIKEL